MLVGFLGRRIGNRWICFRCWREIRFHCRCRGGGAGAPRLLDGCKEALLYHVDWSYVTDVEQMFY